MPPDKFFEGIDGILIPGGFGDRGVEGKINAASYARVKDVPFFGICLGMQCAVIEFARNVLRLKGANSVEFDTKTPHPVIDYMHEQRNLKKLGGTMRLGAYKCTIKEDTLAYKSYGVKEVMERHRHRLEFNNQYTEDFVKAGITVSGVNEERGLVEIIEIKSTDGFWAVSFILNSNQSQPLPIHFLVLLCLLLLDIKRKLLSRKAENDSFCWPMCD